MQSFRRYAAANVPEETRRGQVVVWNPRPAEAGEQAQIDYGQLGRWLDPVTGKLRTVWAFVMVLACSRHMFVRPVLRMDQRAWTECHVEAFADGHFFLPGIFPLGRQGNPGQPRRAQARARRRVMACSGGGRGHSGWFRWPVRRPGRAGSCLVFGLGGQQPGVAAGLEAQHRP